MSQRSRLSLIYFVSFLSIQILASQVRESHQAFFSTLSQGSAGSALTGQSDGSAQVPFKTSFLSASFDNPLLRRNGAALLTSPLANIEHSAQNAHGQFVSPDARLLMNSGLLDTSLDEQLGSVPYDDRRLSSVPSSDSSGPRSSGAVAGAQEDLLAIASQLTQAQANQTGSTQETAANSTSATSMTQQQVTTRASSTSAPSTSSEPSKLVEIVTTTQSPTTVAPQTTAGPLASKSEQSTTTRTAPTTLAPTQTTPILTTQTTKSDKQTSGASEFMTTITVNVTSSEQTTTTSTTTTTTTPPPSRQEPREARELAISSANQTHSTTLATGQQAPIGHSTSHFDSVRQQVPICQNGACKNFLVASVPVLNGTNSSQSVNEFVFLPADSMGPLAFDESAYPINKTANSTYVDSSRLPTEHRTLDGDDDLGLGPVGSEPDSAKLDPRQAGNSSSASFMLVNDNGEVDLDYANMDGADDSAEIGDRLPPIASTSTSTTTTSKTTTTTTSTTSRPNTNRPLKLTTTSTRPIDDAPSKQKLSASSNKGQSLTSNEIRDARQRATSSTTTSTTSKPTTTQRPTQAVNQTSRRNDKFLVEPARAQTATGSNDQKTTTTTSANSTSEPRTSASSSTTSTTTGRPRPMKLESTRLASSRGSRSQDSNHHQFYNEPAGDWQRRRQPSANSRETFSPVNNGADEEEANILTRYLVPSQLARLSSLDRQQPRSSPPTNPTRRTADSLRLPQQAAISPSTTTQRQVRTSLYRTSEATPISPTSQQKATTSISKTTTTSTSTTTSPKLADLVPLRALNSTVRSSVISIAQDRGNANKPINDEPSFLALLNEQDQRDDETSAVSQRAGELLMTLISSSIDESNREQQQQQQQQSHKSEPIDGRKNATVQSSSTTPVTTTATSTTTQQAAATTPASQVTTATAKREQLARVADAQSGRPVDLALAGSKLNGTTLEDDQLARALLEDEQQKRARNQQEASNSYRSTPRAASRRSSSQLDIATKAQFDQTGKWQPDTNVDYALLDYQTSGLATQGGAQSSSEPADRSANLLPGRPGVDYPIHWQVPKTSFDCRNYDQSGFYADVESDCQAYHSCHRGRGGRHTFLCPNGTLFSQELLTCDWWYNVECSASKLYTLDNGATSGRTSDGHHSSPYLKLESDEQ